MKLLFLILLFNQFSISTATCVDQLGDPCGCGYEWYGCPRTVELACVAPATGGSQPDMYNTNCHYSYGKYCAVSYYNGRYSKGCASCGTCAAGKHRGENQWFECAGYCFNCPAGKFQDETGQGWCKDCATGKYATDAVRTTECTLNKNSCGTGKYHVGDTSVAGSCDSCPTGRFQDEGSHYLTSCKLCPQGKYGDTTGLTSESSCKSCPAATPQSGVGSTASSDCKPATCPFGQQNGGDNPNGWDLVYDCDMDGMTSSWFSLNQAAYGMDVTGSLTITGPSNKVTITAKSGYRHFNIVEITFDYLRLTLTNLILKPNGDLDTTDCVNYCQYPRGGAINQYNYPYPPGGWNARPKIILDNIVANDFGSVYEGGVIYSWNADSDIRNSEFKNNEAQRGGAIFQGYGNMETHNNLFEDNYAQYYGGAIYGMGQNMFMYDDVFKNNEAEEYGGGAIMLHANWLYAYRVLFQGNTQTTTNQNHWRKNTYGGGAFYLYENPYVSCRECHFKDNAATAFGDHIFSHQTVVNHPDNTQTLGTPAKMYLVNTKFDPLSGISGGWVRNSFDTNWNWLGQEYMSTSSSESDYATYFKDNIQSYTCSNNPCTESPFQGKCTDTTTVGIPTMTCGYMDDCDPLYGSYNQYNALTVALPPPVSPVPSGTCGSTPTEWDLVRNKGGFKLSSDKTMTLTIQLMGPFVLKGTSQTTLKKLNMNNKYIYSSWNDGRVMRFEYIEFHTTGTYNNHRFQIWGGESTDIHVFKNCIFDGLYRGVKTWSGHTVFENTVFKDITDNGIATGLVNARITITDCSFKDITGTAIWSEPWDEIEITNTVFENIDSNTYGAIRLYQTASTRKSVKIKNCTFKNNDRAIFLAQNVDVDIRECTFSGREAPGSTDYDVVIIYANGCVDNCPGVKLVNAKFSDDAKIYNPQFISDCTSSPCTESPFTGTCVVRANDEGVYCPLATCGAGQTGYILPPLTTCQTCPKGDDYNDANEDCKSYKEKYLDVDTKPTVSAIRTRAQNNNWKSLSSTRKKRQGFRAMMRWIRSQFTSRKAKMRKDDLILSTAFKTKMGTRTDVEVIHPKDGDTECDVFVDAQPDSFDITLTDVGDTGIVCKGSSIKISKLKLDTINDDSNDYTYYCHDGSGWENGVSISSGGDYSCDGRKFHVN